MSGPSTTCPSPGPGNNRLWRLFGFVCRYLLAAVFLMAALTKITNLGAFEDQVLLHSNLPWWLGRPVAAVLPWLELVCGLCLAIGWAAREAAVLTTMLLILFLAHGLAVRDEDCHCFFLPGPLTTTRWWWPPLRNLLLLACSIRVAWPRRESGPP